MQKSILTTSFLLMTTLLSYSQSEPQTFTVDSVTYAITSEKTAGVYKVNTKLKEVIIPETIQFEENNYTITTVEERAFYWSNATKIVIPNTVTELKYAAIYSCDELTDLTLSENLKKLGANSLAYLDQIESITIPEGVEIIPENCFARNEKMTTINLPSTIKEIGDGAFYKVAINNFTVPEECKKIGKNVFQLAKNLTNVTFNENIEEIGDGAFRECHSLSSINLHALNKLKQIPSNLFLECPLQAEIEIPAAVEQIGTAAFGSTQVASIKLNPANQFFSINNGVLYNADESILVLYPPKSEQTEYTIPNTCIGIGAGAFYGSNITKLNIPESVIAIDAYAFCSSQLKETTFPNSIIYMGEQALAGTQFTELTLPKNLTYIADGLCASNKVLEKVTIPENVRWVYNHAFTHCTNLKEVYSLAAVAPSIDLWWGENDSPFGWIDCTSIEFHIPEGSTDSYNEKAWNELFSDFLETEPKAFVYKAISPAKDSLISQIENINIYFDQEATIADGQPKVIVRKDNDLYGDLLESTNGWMAINDSEDPCQVSLFPCDYDGFVSPIQLEAGSTYFITIPENIIKNTEEVFNQRIVLQYEATSQGVNIISNSDDTDLLIQNGHEFLLKTGVNDVCNVSIYNTSGHIIKSIPDVIGQTAFYLEDKGVYLIRVMGQNIHKTFKVRN